MSVCFEAWLTGGEGVVHVPIPVTITTFPIVYPVSKLIGKVSITIGFLRLLCSPVQKEGGRVSATVHD